MYVWLCLSHFFIFVNDFTDEFLVLLLSFIGFDRRFTGGLIRIHFTFHQLFLAFWGGRGFLSQDFTVGIFTGLLLYFFVPARRVAIQGWSVAKTTLFPFPSLVARTHLIKFPEHLGIKARLGFRCVRDQF